jgi:DNA polymerase III, gamma/tau subunits
MATNDPQKLPITIQSRCLQLHLQHHQESHISDHLENILKSLNKNYDKQAIEQLAKAADGSLRDALSLLEQAIATSEETLENDTICQMLGSAPTEDIMTLIHAISLKNNIEVSETLTKMEHNHHNHETIIDQMLNMLYQTTKQQILPNAEREANPDIVKLANAIDSNQIQMYIQILIQGKKDISLYPSQVMGFNLIVMRMLAFKLEENNLLSLIEKKNLTLTEDSPNLEKHQKAMTTTINTSNQTASEILKQANSQINTESSNDRTTSNDKVAQIQAKVENPNNSQSTQEDRKPTENDWKMVMESSQVTGMIKQL